MQVLTPLQASDPISLHIRRLSVSRATGDAKVAVGRQLAGPYTNRPRPKNRSP